MWWLCVSGVSVGGGGGVVSGVSVGGGGGGVVSGVSVGGCVDRSFNVIVHTLVLF